jgi:hypothetical protein
VIQPRRRCKPGRRSDTQGVRLDVPPNLRAVIPIVVVSVLKALLKH